jgi:hypothetical protein
MAANFINARNGLLGNPGFTGPGGSGNQTVGPSYGSQCIDLKGIRDEFPAGRYPDACKNIL